MLYTFCHHSTCISWEEARRDISSTPGLPTHIVSLKNSACMHPKNNLCSFEMQLEHLVVEGAKC